MHGPFYIPVQRSTLKNANKTERTVKVNAKFDGQRRPKSQRRHLCQKRLKMLRENF